MNHPGPTTRRSRHAPRRGAVYLVVLIGVSVVSMMAVTGMLVEAAAATGQTRREESAEARLLALSGIDLVLRLTNTLPGWRAAAKATPVSTWAIGAGSVTITLVDEADGDIANNSTDPLAVFASARFGRSRHMMRAVLEPRIGPVGTLASTVHAGRLVFGSYGDLATGGTLLSSSANISAGSVRINSNVESTGLVSGTKIVGTVTNNAPARSLPSSSVTDWYVANGTKINWTSLTSDGGTSRRIDRAVLSPATNPYGAQNASGIYWIDCGGNRLRIRRSRIVGTLVVFNPSSDSEIDGSVNWSPASPEYPALIVSGGSIVFNLSGGVLDEDDENTNFNPWGTPYQGSWDFAQNDWYPSTITGMVYVDGSAQFNTGSSSAAYTGPFIISGTLTFPSGMNMQCTYEPAYYDSPPPGFTGPVGMLLVKGSVEQLAE